MASTLANRRNEDLFREDNPTLWLEGDWLDVVFIHYRMEPEILQPFIPYPLDLHEGAAYLSLVAFTMNRLRPNIGGKLSELAFRPISTHQFLNIRAYVNVNDEGGIMFLAEVLNNPWSIPLGPLVYALPYRLGKIEYHHDGEQFHGFIRVGGREARFSAEKKGMLSEAKQGSLAEFLLERYSAFNAEGGKRKMFRVQHEPWQARETAAERLDESLLEHWYPWFKHASYCGAHHSPGVRQVKMGLPMTL